MKLQISVIVILLLLGISYSFGQSNPDDLQDGKIIESTQFEFPAYEDQYYELKEIFTKETYPQFSESPDLELLNIKYMSDGLKIAGFLYKPRVTEGKKLPLIILNRWGVGIHGQIRPASMFIYEMFRYASEGFVVIMTQYRGSGGSEGKDIIGTTEMIDLWNLLPLAKSLGYVDMDNIYMHGLSRGGLVTLLAIKKNFPLKAAVVIGAAYNIVELVKNTTVLLDYLPDYKTKKEEYKQNFTATLWADKLNVPLLIFHGGEDAITPLDPLLLAQKLEENCKLYELVIYSKDGHNTTKHREERIQKTIDWFKNPRTIPIKKPIRCSLEKRGFEEAVKLYKTLKNEKYDMYHFDRAELNILGYELIGSNKIDEAIEIFKLNVSEYPDAWNPYDSLGEAYMISGDNDLAIKYYEKSLELNPDNTNATEKLKELRE
ncbi:prolyl oligopeptidase family serine peptidase [Bacteroidota bacterium]